MEILVAIIVFIVCLWGFWKCVDYIKLNTISIDPRGYERNGYGRLVHRDIAYKHHYRTGFRYGRYTKRFRYYDVHHIDGDKRNNYPDNLQILTREKHKRIHGS